MVHIITAGVLHGKEVINMPNKTSIEWTDYTSNPIVPVGGGWGCSKVSPGC